MYRSCFRDPCNAAVHISSLDAANCGPPKRSPQCGAADKGVPELRNFDTAVRNERRKVANEVTIDYTCLNEFRTDVAMKRVNQGAEKCTFAEPLAHLVHHYRHDVERNV